MELWLEVALDLINFDVNVEEQDKKASVSGLRHVMSDMLLHLRL